MAAGMLLLHNEAKITGRKNEILMLFMSSLGKVGSRGGFLRFSTALAPSYYITKYLILAIN